MLFGGNLKRLATEKNTLNKKFKLNGIFSYKENQAIKQRERHLAILLVWPTGMKIINEIYVLMKDQERTSKQEILASSNTKGQANYYHYAEFPQEWVKKEKHNILYY